MNYSSYKEKRDEIVNRINEIYSKSRRPFSNKIRKELDELEDKYFESLPILTMGCCPFCEEVLKSKFDPFNINSFWWKTPFSKYIYFNCDHFYLLAGALNYNDKRPMKGIPNSTSMQPGPEVPFIYEDELEPEGRIAVISQIKMEVGYTAYPITYFSKIPKKLGQFAPAWKTEFVSIKNESGIDEWYSYNWDIDFNLMPWLEKGKLKWCDPDTDNTQLSTLSIDKCPYIDLPGKKRRVKIDRTSFYYIGRQYE
jgi:hypothetical protein